MTNWKRTFKMDDVKVDGHKSGAQVWTAIPDTLPCHALGSLDIAVDTDHGHALIRLSMTPKQMHDLAFHLNVHANRLEELEAEVALLVPEAA